MPTRDWVLLEECSQCGLADQPLGMGVEMYKQNSFQEQLTIRGEESRGIGNWRPDNDYLQMGVELSRREGLVLFTHSGAGFLGAEVSSCASSADKINDLR